MPRLADATAYLKSDNSDLKKGLTESESEVSGWGGRMGNVMQGVGMAVGMGVAGLAADAAGKMVGFMQDGMAAASDLGETVSKTGVVFGENAAAVLAWGETAATALGQSKADALGAASTFGNLFVSMGMGSDVSAGMSMDLVQLATDLASFNNMSTDEALEKLKAGMLGSAEPMQSLGVNMTAASVTAKALEMGLAASADALTPAMLAQARYAVILEQTTTAQGDFARTSDGLANQQRIADAQWKELQTTMGTLLLPVMTAVTTAFNSLLTNVLPPLSAFLSSTAGPAVTAFGDILGSLVNYFTAVVEDGDTLNDWLTHLPEPMQGIVLFIAETLIPGFTSLGTTVKGAVDGPMAYAQKWFTDNMPRIQTIVENVLKAIKGFWDTYGASISLAVETLVNAVIAFWDVQFRTIGGIVQAILQLLTGDFTGAGNTIKGIIDLWWNMISGAVTTVVNSLKSAFTSIDWGAVGKGILDGIAAGIRNGAEAIKSAAQTAANSALDAAKNLLGIHSPSSVAAAEIGKPFAQGIGQGIRDSLSGLSGGVNSGLQGLMAGITTPQGAVAAGGTFNITINVNGGDGATLGLAARDGVLSALRSAGLR